MKTKVAVIGNSHLAAFKLGWNSIQQDYPKLQLAFFGSPSTSFRFLQVKGNALFPTRDTVAESLRWTSGGLDHIPAAFDAYILVGMGFSFIHLMTLLKTHRLIDHYDPTNSLQQLISEDFFKAAMLGTLKNSNALTLIGQLRQLSAAPMFYAPNPYGAIDILTAPEHEHYFNKRIREQAFSFYCETLLETFCGTDVIAVGQPKKTIADRMFTKSKYSRGSIKLKRGMASAHDSDDYFHMNEKFGVVCLRDILWRIDS